MNVRSAAVSVLLFCSTVLAAPADTVDQWIARARAHLGSETALNDVASIHYTGRIEGIERVQSPSDKTKLVEQPVSIPTDIVFQKPFQQRVTLTRTETVETSGLDGYDAWTKTQSLKVASQWRVTLLEPRQIKALRANTWETLYFYRGLDKNGGSVQLGGDEVVDGLACIKLNFVHDTAISFQRFFDKASGRLVKTITENGTEIREEGELVEGGVRFPHKIVQKAPDGVVTTVIFEKVELNRKFPAGEFAVPSLQQAK